MSLSKTEGSNLFIKILMLAFLLQSPIHLISDGQEKDFRQSDQGNVESLSFEPSSNKDGGISGTVYYPMTNINVIAYDMGGNVVKSSITNDRGEFHLYHLPSGYYKIFFDTQNIDYRYSYLSEWFNHKDSFESADQILVYAGNTTRNINFTLTNGGSISGHMTNTSGGDVGAGITAKAYDVNQKLVSSATVSPNGYYAIQRLKAGAYKVFFDGTGSACSGEWYKYKQSFAAADSIAVTLDNTTQLDEIQMKSSGSISGKVTNFEGSGLSNIYIRCYNIYFEQISATSTNQAGDYSLQGLAGGDYKIYFVNSTQYTNFASEWYDNKYSFAEAIPVTVNFGQNTPNINISLASGAIIKGKVTNLSGSGVATSVTVYDLNNSYVNSSSSNSSGDYEIKNLSPGNFKIKFGYEPILKWYNNKETFSEADIIAITEGQTISGINAVLAVAGQISGTVNDPQGNGINDIRVQIYNLDLELVKESSTQNGIFNISIAPGIYKVFFNTDSGQMVPFISEWNNDKPSYETADAVTIPSNGNVQVNAILKNAASISGIVTNDYGEGINNIKVCAYDSSKNLINYCITDDYGHYIIYFFNNNQCKLYFETSLYPELKAEWYNNKASFEISDALLLSDEQNLTGVNAQLKQITSNDLACSFSGAGVWAYHSKDNSWSLLNSSEAEQIAFADLDGDKMDDLIGWWNNPDGIWQRLSCDGSWSKIMGKDNLVWLTAGDLNGDGKNDLLGSWTAIGVWWRNSANGFWERLHPDTASMVATGDLNGDGADEMIGVWASGIWAGYQNGTWQKILDSANLKFLTTGDLNGDGYDDLVGSWTYGLWCRDSLSGNWTYLYTSAEKICSGDLDSDGKDDLIGLWTGAPGVWLKYSSTSQWAKIHDTIPKWIAAGKMTNEMMKKPYIYIPNYSDVTVINPRSFEIENIISTTASASCVDWDQKGTTIYIGHEYNQTITAIDPANNQVRKTIGSTEGIGRIETLRANPIKDYLYAFGYGGLFIINTSNREMALSKILLIGSISEKILISKDGNKLFHIKSNNIIQIFDTNKLNVPSQNPKTPVPITDELIISLDLSSLSTIRSFALSPDGSTLFVTIPVANNTELRFYNTTNLSLNKKITINTSVAVELLVHPNGMNVYTFDTVTGNILIINCVTSQIESIPYSYSDQYNDGSGFHPDGSQFYNRSSSWNAPYGYLDFFDTRSKSVIKRAIINHGSSFFEGKKMCGYLADTVAGKITLNGASLYVNLNIVGQSETFTINNSGDGGSYKFAARPEIYTITPVKEGYTFSPASRQVTVNKSLTNLDFIATDGTQPLVDITATPEIIGIGGQARLEWTSINGLSATLNGETVSLNDFRLVSPLTTTTYTIIVEGAQGKTATDSVTITVKQIPTATISAEPKNVQAGGEVTLTWQSTDGDSATLNGETVLLNGTKKVNPNQPTSYTLIATGLGGSCQASATVTTDLEVKSFAASPVWIKNGDSSTLTWDVLNATSISIDPGVGAVGLSGSIPVKPDTTTEYTLTASKGSDIIQKRITVTVSSQVPTVNIQAFPASVMPGQKTELAWTSQDAQAVNIDQSIGTVEPNGSLTVTPNPPVTYTITATNPAGNATAHVTVTSSPFNLNIQYPNPGEVFNTPFTMVQGYIENPAPGETAVTVNGLTATVSSNVYTVYHVPLNEGDNIIRVCAADAGGHTAGTSRTVKYEIPETNHFLTLKAFPESGICAPGEIFKTTLILDSTFPYNFYNNAHVTCVPPANGQYTLPEHQYREIPVELNGEGIYSFSCSIFYDGNYYSDTVTVQVFSKSSVDLMLKQKWNDMKSALLSRNTDQALAYICFDSRDHYRQVFTELSGQIPDMVQLMGVISPVYFSDEGVKYRTTHEETIQGQTYTITNFVYFVIDDDGIWRIWRF